MGRLSNKVAVVTGATSGIGEGVALMFAAEGAKVVGVGRNDKKGAELVKRITDAGGEATFIRADLLQKENVSAIRNTALKAYGQVDVLVNGAGVLVHKPFLQQNDADLDLILETNFRSCVWTMQSFIPVMVEAGGGSIINIASISAIWPESNAYFYGAMKAAVNKLSRDVAREFARQHVRINTILPGPTDTPMVPDYVKNDPAVMQEVIDTLALLGRLSTPEDIAYAAVYLASDESLMVTGQQMVVDSGVTISNP
ncbi:SDR family oxidoreductase [Sodalis sp. dw_96]|uniref:SDR family NAD(P)-dependent oxidoreductase n=1 Tax=Sodalis sp. dw_96 TaxID=2719794 RepID=UPI001BD572A9|nr:SDR family oxidoreductase [Sodalis sp. dw_96]